LLNENSTGVLREVIEHISVMGVQRILERLMLLAASLYPCPAKIRVKQALEEPEDLMVDFSRLNSGQYSLELTSTNSGQSKATQIDGLMQLLNLLAKTPDAVRVGEPLIKQIATLWGIKNIDSMLADIQQRYLEQKTEDLGRQQILNTLQNNP